VVAVALGLIGVLTVSGLIEAVVTPSPLPTVARIGIGMAAEIAFLAYIFHFGRKAAMAGETGDIDDAPDVIPTH
jgi:predicted cation transporter